MTQLVTIVQRLRVLRLRGLRVGEAENSGPVFDIAFGNISSLPLHMPYISTINAHVMCMTETRLTPFSTVESREQLQAAGKQFYPGSPQPFRRPSRITLRDAVPGGVGAWGLLGVQMSYVPRATEGWTDEEIRRSLFLVITPGSGFEPIHIAVVYSFSGAMSDINKLHANEALLGKVFAEMNAFWGSTLIYPR